MWYVPIGLELHLNVHNAKNRVDESRLRDSGTLKSRWIGRSGQPKAMDKLTIKERRCVLQERALWGGVALARMDEKQRRASSSIKKIGVDQGMKER